MRPAFEVRYREGAGPRWQVVRLHDPGMALCRTTALGRYWTLREADDEAGRLTRLQECLCQLSRAVALRAAWELGREYGATFGARVVREERSCGGEND